MKVFFKKYYKQIIIITLFIILLTSGILLKVFGRQTEIKNNEETNESYQITATIEGEVMYPNSYYLEEGSTVRDLIRLASGLTSYANTSFINLNKELKDGETIYITKNLTEPSKRININNASFEELKTLDGIGETLAYNIIVYRTINGVFNSINDLLKVNGMSIKIINKNINEITLS